MVEETQPSIKEQTGVPVWTERQAGTGTLQLCLSSCADGPMYSPSASPPTPALRAPDTPQHPPPRHLLEISSLMVGSTSLLKPSSLTTTGITAFLPAPPASKQTKPDAAPTLSSCLWKRAGRALLLSTCRSQQAAPLLHPLLHVTCGAGSETPTILSEHAPASKTRLR